MLLIQPSFSAGQPPLVIWQIVVQLPFYWMALTITPILHVQGRVFFHSEKGFRVETNDPAIAPGVAGSLLAETRVIPTLISIQDIDVTTRESANITIISVDAALTAINETVQGWVPFKTA